MSEVLNEFWRILANSGISLVGCKILTTFHHHNYANYLIRVGTNTLANLMILTILTKLAKFYYYMFPSLSRNVGRAPCTRESSMYFHS